MKCVLARLLLLLDTAWTPTESVLWECSATGRATWEQLLRAVTALYYKNGGFSVLGSCSSILAGETCCEERNLTLRSISHRADEGKQQPPSGSHNVRKQAKTAILWLFFSLWSLVSWLLSPSGWKHCKSLIQKRQGHEDNWISLLFNESAVQIIKGFRSWQESSMLMGLITQVLLPWFSLAENSNNSFPPLQNWIHERLSSASIIEILYIFQRELKMHGSVDRDQLSNAWSSRCHHLLSSHLFLILTVFFLVF